jgi:hypothetical protein
MGESQTQQISPEELEAMVRLSVVLDEHADRLRAEMRHLIAAVGEPPKLWTGSILGIILDVLLESHPKDELTGAVIGIGVAMWYRAGADLAPILELVQKLWADFEGMARVPD